MFTNRFYNIALNILWITVIILEMQKLTLGVRSNLQFRRLNLPVQ